MNPHNVTVRDARSWIGPVATFVLLGLLVLRVATGVHAGRGSSVLLGLLLAGLLLCIAVMVGAALRARQLSRIRATIGPEVQAWRVIEPQRVATSRFLLVSPANGSASLTDGHGHPLVQWNSVTFKRVGTKPLYPAGSRVPHRGLVLHAHGHSDIEILLPSLTTMTYPARYRNEVKRALAAAFGPSVVDVKA